MKESRTCLGRERTSKGLGCALEIGDRKATSSEDF